MRECLGAKSHASIFIHPSTRLLAQTVFLSDLAVQLFVQTLLSTKDIDSVVSGETAYADDEDLEGGPPARGLDERRDTLDELATREAIRYGPRED